MSLGSQRPTGHLRAAIAYAVAKGVVVVASAGNDGTPTGNDPFIYPASYPGVIGVAAVTSSGARAWFSEQNPAVVISAPGVNVLGVGPQDDYADGEGTSPAAAFVSGVVALIRSRYPGLSPALVEQALITSTTLRPVGGYSASTGFGEVNAAAALATAARLAAIRPAAGLAPDARFASGAANSVLGAIQVIHWDGASIDGYTAAAAAGTLCCVVALALVPVAARRRPPAFGTAEGPGVPPAAGTPEEPALPPAEGTAEEPALPPAEGTAEGPGVPPAESTLEEPGVPPAAGTAEEPDVPPAAGTPEVPGVPPADGTDRSG
jgi:hypothetical protein